MNKKIYLLAATALIISGQAEAMNNYNYYNGYNPHVGNSHQHVQLYQNQVVQVVDIKPYKQHVEIFINDRIKKSYENKQSVSWLFREKFKNENMNDIKKDLKTSIETLTSSFFKDLHQIRNDVGTTITTYQDLMNKYKFSEITQYQENPNCGQLIFAHSTGMILRLKADLNREAALAISFYKKQEFQDVVSFLEKPESPTRLYNLQLTLSGKSRSEACKLLLDVYNEKIKVDPVPSFPGAVDSQKLIQEMFKEEKLNKLSFPQKSELMDHLTNLVMGLGHLKTHLSPEKEEVEEDNIEMMDKFPPVLNYVPQYLQEDYRQPTVEEENTSQFGKIFQELGLKISTFDFYGSNKF